MTILAVDSSAQALRQFSQALAAAAPDAEVLSFESSLAALAAARERDVDVAFLETDMPELGGLDLGQYLKELHPLINLIYLTKSPDRGYDALALHASGYLLKPATPQALRRELGDLRHPAREKRQRVFEIGRAHV